MKWIKPALVAALALPMVGCLTVETIETRIQLRDRGEPLLIIEYMDISSGEAYAADVKKDFDELIGSWQGDQYLLDRNEEGIIIKNREVFIRDGKIIGRLTGIVKNLHEKYSFWTSNGERIMLFRNYEGDEDYELVETNGKILKTNENIILVWPMQTNELWWKEHEKNHSESSDKNRSPMVQMLKEHLAGQAKTSSKP